MTPTVPVRVSATRRFECGFDAHDGQMRETWRNRWMAAAVAVLQATTRAFDAVAFEQIARERAGAGDDVGVVTLAVGRMATVSKIDKSLGWQLGTQGRATRCQPTDAAVKDTDGACQTGSFTGFRCW